MIVRTMVQICAKFLISRLKTGEAMATSLVAMVTATLILFLDVGFELIEARIWLIYFMVLLSTVSVHYVCFSEKF